MLSRRGNASCQRALASRWSSVSASGSMPALFTGPSQARVRVNQSDGLQRARFLHVLFVPRAGPLIGSAAQVLENGYR